MILLSALNVYIAVMGLAEFHGLVKTPVCDSVNKQATQTKQNINNLSFPPEKYKLQMSGFYPTAEA